MVLAGRYHEEILHRKFVNMNSLPLLPQLVCAEILGQGIYERHLRLVDLVSEHFPRVTKLSRPQGGIVAWLELPESVDTTELYHYCRDHNVLIAPGEMFSLNNQFRNCFRLSYANRWNAEREVAIRRLGTWVGERLSTSAG